MTNPSLDVATIGSRLERIDAELAAGHVDLCVRPLHATIAFIRHHVSAVDDGISVEPVPDSVSAILGVPWSQSIYVVVKQWYVDRYGTSLAHPKRLLKGVVLLHGTAFALDVPSVSHDQGADERTMELRFLSAIEEGEDPKSWIVSPPTISSLSSEDIADVWRIASALRSINVRLVGTAQTDPIATGFLSGIPLHLATAAELALRHRPDESVQRGYWELQMACECALKGLIQGKTARYQQTHDLFLLYDAAQPLGLVLNRDILKILPRWKDMTELRYGQVADASLSVFYQAYLVALQVVDAALAPGVTLDLTNASITIRSGPFS